MIGNGIHHHQNKHKSVQHVSDDQQSNELVIEPPKKQMTMHTDFDIKYQETQRFINMYIELDPKNIANLTKENLKNKAYDDERRFYKDCIFMRKILTPQSQIKANFRISFLHYKGITFTVQFLPKQKKDQDGLLDQQLKDFYCRMKQHIKNPESWDTKWLDGKLEDTANKIYYNFQVPASDIDKVLKQKLLLQIYFEKPPSLTNLYRGILNQGNTCYANSTLQVLFHFKPLRKMIVQLPTKRQKKLTKVLQQIFVDLITERSTVRVQNFIQCFEKVLDQPQRQQDIHQFLISFFDYLQSELPQVAQFWTGKDFETTYSKQVPYQSKQQQNFNQLQLQMADTKGNQHRQIKQSLKQLLQQDRADEPIDVQGHGKIAVFKQRNFCAMPPLLFMNIKRYEYNPKRRELKKINLDLSYPSQINLDFLMKTAAGLDYVLYSVIVHKGRTPNSGHYFCFINTSTNPDVPQWYQFNDSNVRKAKQTKVLNNFTGRKKQQIYLNQQYGKWAERQEVSQQTAYLLTYILKDQFQQFQSLQAIIPTWHTQRIQKKLTQDEARTMVAVKLYVLRVSEDFFPFSLHSQQMMEVKLKKEETLESQIKKLQKMLSCKVGTIWKVNCKTGTIKHINKEYGEQCKITVSCHTEFKRGMRQPDYFLIIPHEKMAEVDDWQRRKLGLLHVEQITDEKIIQKFGVLSKQDIHGKIQQMKKGGGNLTYNKQLFQQFVYGWNDYLYIKHQI